MKSSMNQLGSVAGLGRMGKTHFGILLSFCLTLPAWGQYFWLILNLHLHVLQNLCLNWIFIYLRTFVKLTFGIILNFCFDSEESQMHVQTPKGKYGCEQKCWYSFKKMIISLWLDHIISQREDWERLVMIDSRNTFACTYLLTTSSNIFFEGPLRH